MGGRGYGVCERSDVEDGSVFIHFRCGTKPPHRPHLFELLATVQALAHSLDNVILWRLVSIILRLHCVGHHPDALSACIALGTFSCDP